MQHTQQESIFSSVRKIFPGTITAQKSSTEMRLLTEDELRAVAGGPELEVSTGG